VHGLANGKPDLCLKLFSKLLDAEIEYLALVLEVQVQDGTGNAALVGYLLERGIRIALLDKHVKGIFQNLLLPFIVFNGD